MYVLNECIFNVISKIIITVLYYMYVQNIAKEKF